MIGRNEVESRLGVGVTCEAKEGVETDGSELFGGID